MQNSLTTARITPIADSTTALKITKANGTTDVVTVDTTNGRVGIGCTPSSIFNVQTPSGTGLLANFDHVGTAEYAGSQYMENGVVKGFIQHMGSTFSTSARQNMVEMGGAAGVGVSLMAGGTERVRIDSGGLVGIGCTPSYQIELSTNSAGKPGSEHWTVTSDARLKQDITDIADPLTKLLSLRGRTFQWIPSERSTQGEGTCMGFIAQEVEPVFPKWVGTNAKGTKHLTTSGMDALIVEAIRAINARLEALEAKE